MHEKSPNIDPNRPLRFLFTCAIRLAWENTCLMSIFYELDICGGGRVFLPALQKVLKPNWGSLGRLTLQSGAVI